ncbi:MAG: mercuric transport protein [Flavobacteriaceae bacterium]|nr:mercuric transport protein [Flavobacteriaceae bacterium]
MSDVANIVAGEAASSDDSTKTKLIAAGGILGAIAASTCCVVPLVLFSLGISGAWMANLTALTPYKPIFIAITLGFLGYGYYLVYRKPKVACAEDSACAKPLPNRLVKGSLWFATILVLIAFSWPVIIPYLAPLVFGY